MIVVCLRGRLGNQLFQYAAGRALALRLGVELGLDKRVFTRTRRHNFGLDAFGIKTTLVKSAALPANDRGLRRRLRRLLRPQRRTPFSEFREHDLTFDPAVLQLPDWTYLDGYFQSDLYFADHAATIRTELAVLPLQTPTNKLLGESIANCYAVSLHVRRGDYVTKAAYKSRFSTLGPDYYARAVEAIAARAKGRPTVFIFSDDPDWAEANVRLEFPTHVVRQTGAAYEDIRLMAACHHHIIANSSFSWWGAWLNPLATKIVVAPATWFKDPTRDTSTLIPGDWLRI